jgi:hypothetical protein
MIQNNSVKKCRWFHALFSDPIPLILLAVLLLNSCATLKPGDIPEPAIRREPEAPKARLSWDIYLFRIDLSRETLGGKEETRTINKDGTYKPITDLVPYNYIGVYLGNGFFVDLNGNFCIDIVKLLGLEAHAYFSLEKIDAGSLDGAALYIKDGAGVTIQEGDSSEKKITAEIEDSRVEIDTSRFFAPTEISWNEGEIRLHPAGLFSEFKKGSIKGRGELFVFGSGFRVEQTGPEEVLLNNTHRITKAGNEIRYHIGDRILLTMVRTENRYVFFRSPDYGFFIEKLSDRIRIVRNGVETLYLYETRKGF